MSSYKLSDYRNQEPEKNVAPDSHQTLPRTDVTDLNLADLSFEISDYRRAQAPLILKKAAGAEGLSQQPMSGIEIGGAGFADWGNGYGYEVQPVSPIQPIHQYSDPEPQDSVLRIGRVGITSMSSWTTVSEAVDNLLRYSDRDSIIDSLKTLTSEGQDAMSGLQLVNPTQAKEWNTILKNAPAIESSWRGRIPNMQARIRDDQDAIRDFAMLYERVAEIMTS